MIISRGGYVLTIDVSRAQGAKFNFAAARELGAEACFICTTEGEDYVDPMADTHRARAVDAGFMVGGYHVFRPEHQDPTVQARFHADKARAWTMLCPVEDLERTSQDHGIPMELVAQRAAVYARAVGPLWRKLRSLVYGSPAYFNGLMATAAGTEAVLQIADHASLWSAKYGPEPGDPEVSPWVAYTGWQWTNKLAVDGVLVDASWFRGTVNDLAQLGATV